MVFGDCRVASLDVGAQGGSNVTSTTTDWRWLRRIVLRPQSAQAQVGRGAQSNGLGVAQCGGEGVRDVSDCARPLLVILATPSLES